MSAKKQKRFAPKTPAKKNRSHASHELYSPFANILHFSEETQISSKRDDQNTSISQNPTNNNYNTGDQNTKLGSGVLNGSSFSNASFLEQRRMKVTTIQLQKTNRFHTDFQLISKLGEGSFGEAFKVRSLEDGKLYAVKKAKDKYQGYKDREQKLLEVHRALKLTKIGQDQKLSSDIQIVRYSDYCVKVYEAWEESGYLYIRSELCEKGNLNDYLVELEKLQTNELLKEEDIWKFLFQMACAIKHVHDSGFVHLDIKPSNFFVMADGSIKLGDFGQAIELCNLQKIRDDDVEGDSVYMAPELLKNNLRVNERITKKADIFSLGASLLELASGMNLPQNGLMWQKLRQGDLIQFSPSAGRSDQIEALINLLMEPNPENRPDIDEVLLHPKLQTISANLNPSIKRNLRLTHLESPIVEKLKNPLSTKNKSNRAELILISPRILKSASKQIQYQRKTKNQFSSGDSDQSFDEVKVDDYFQEDYNYQSSDFQRAKVKNNSGDKFNTRTVGRSNSFVEEQELEQKAQSSQMPSLFNQENRNFQSTALTNKHQTLDIASMQGVTGGHDYTSLFKSSKKLKFEMQEKKDGDNSHNSSFHDVIPFNIPNEQNHNGNTSYNGFLNNRNLNNLFETVDEIMTEEDHESVVSASMQSSGNHSSGYNAQNVFQAIHISQLKLNELNNHSKQFSFNENYNSMNFNHPDLCNHSSSNTLLQVTPHLNGKASILSNMSRTSSSATSNNNDSHMGSGGFQLRSSNQERKKKRTEFHQPVTSYNHKIHGNQHHYLNSQVNSNRTSGAGFTLAHNHHINTTVHHQKHRHSTNFVQHTEGDQASVKSFSLGGSAKKKLFSNHNSKLTHNQNQTNHNSHQPSNPHFENSPSIMSWQQMMHDDHTILNTISQNNSGDKNHDSLMHLESVLETPEILQVHQHGSSWSLLNNEFTDSATVSQYLPQQQQQPNQIFMNQNGFQNFDNQTFNQGKERVEYEMSRQSGGNQQFPLSRFSQMGHEIKRNLFDA